VEYWWRRSEIFQDKRATVHLAQEEFHMDSPGIEPRLSWRK
jgi:hypothetical protein